MNLPNNKCEVLIPIRGDCIYFEHTLNSLRESVADGLSVCIVYSDVSNYTINLVKQILSHGNLRFLNADGLSLAQKLGLGVFSSSSEYIMRIDADDLIIQGRVAKQLRILESNPEIALVASRMNYIDLNGRSVGTSEKYLSETKQLLKIGCHIGHPSVMMRRSQILESGNYKEFSRVGNTSIAEDFYLWARILQKNQIYILDEVLTEYRVHPNQISNKHELQRMAASLLIRGWIIQDKIPAFDHNIELIWESPQLSQLFLDFSGSCAPECELWRLDFSYLVLKSLARTTNFFGTPIRKSIMNLRFLAYALMSLAKLRRHRQRLIKAILR